MIPYFVWALIVNPLFFYTWDGTIEWTSIIESVFITNSTFWFLPCLFVLMVCYYVYKLTRENLQVKKWVSEMVVAIIIGAFVFLLLELTHLEVFRFVLNYYIPFWIGIFMGQYPKLYDVITDNPFISASCFFAFCLLEGLFYSSTGVIANVTRLMCGTMAIPILFGFFKHYKFSEKQNELFCHLGKNTLPIYVMHYLFIDGLPIISGLNVFCQILVFSILSIAIISLILFVVKLLEMNSVLRFALLGRK